MLWNPKGGLLHESNLGSDATSPGTLVTTGSPATAKGAIAQVIAATAFDAYVIRIEASRIYSAGVATESALDILLGTPTEYLLIPNLLFGYAASKSWEFPLYIPAGTEISAQAASARTSTAFRLYVHLSGGHGSPPFRVGAKVSTYGMGTVPNGTVITPGTSGANGAWAQIVASTSMDHFALLPSFQVTGDTTINSLVFLVGIGLGAGGAEQLIDGYNYHTDNTEFMNGPSRPFPAYRDIPSGSRLAMRAANSGANDAGYNGVIHALS